MGIIYGLKVSLHVAIVAMVNQTAVGSAHGRDTSANSSGSSDDCGHEDSGGGKAATEDGPFLWSQTSQGIILSAYFWGYMVSEVPGGRLAELVSAKWVMFFAVADNVICTALTPLLANIHFTVIIELRVAMGLGGGVTFPAMHVMLSNWAPPPERSVMSSIVYSGTAHGTVIFMLISGVIAASINWQAIFYIQGAVSGLWLLLWFFLIADTPQKHKFISAEEREFITAALNKPVGGEGEQPKLPWKALITSPAFEAILIAHTCNNWIWYMVLIELPLYMKMILKFKISENAVLTAVPFVCMWLFSMVMSKILDTLQEKGKISPTVARKVVTGFATIIPEICFVLLSYIGCQRMLAVTLMSVGGMFCGILSNHIDIAPNFAGTLMALTNTVATIPGILVPLFVGKLTGDNPTIGSWRIIFWVTVALYIVEVTVYTIFGSGEEQPWNKGV